MNIQEWFQGLELREQRLVVVGAIVVVIALFYAGVLAPLSTAVANGTERVETLEGSLANMQRMAAQIRVLRRQGGQANTCGGQPLVVIVDRTTRQAQLSGSLTGSQPTGQTGIRVRFESAPFDALIQWLAQLQSDCSIQIRSASFDSAQRNGLVKANLLLERGAS